MHENQIYYYLVSEHNKVKLVPREQIFLQLPFSDKEAESMINHMNEDHSDAMRGYLKMVNLFDGRDPTMTAIGGDGFLLELQSDNETKVIKFEFAEICHSPMQVRKSLVSLAKASR